MTSSRDITVLMRWLNDCGIIWDQDRFQVQRTTGTDPTYAWHARTRCQAGDIVARIPNVSLLSVQRTAVAFLLMDVRSIDPHCTLAMAVLCERQQSTESPWHGYLQAMPERVDLPSIWSMEHRQWLRGTELEGYVINDRMDLWSDYQQTCVPFTKRYPTVFDKPLSFTAYCEAVSVVRSHSVFLDQFQGPALVPSMNLLGKKTGSPQSSQARLVDAGELALVCSNRIVQETLAGAAGVDLRAAGHQQEQDDAYFLVLTQNAAPGDVIERDYGSVSSSELLLAHGFCYQDDTAGTFSVSGELVFDVCVMTVRDTMCGKQRRTPTATLDAAQRVKERFEYFYAHMHNLLPAIMNEAPVARAARMHVDNDSGGPTAPALERMHHHAFYASPDGRYSDELILLLHMVFLSDDMYRLIQQHSAASMAQPYLASCMQWIHYAERAPSGYQMSRAPDLQQLHRLIYSACTQLSERRRDRYEHPGILWTPAADDEHYRDTETGSKQVRQALTVRINEKRAIQKSIDYYHLQLLFCMQESYASCVLGSLNTE